MSNRPPFKQAFTFDDVLLVPQKSSVLPRDVNLKTRLTNDIDLNIPILGICYGMQTLAEQLGGQVISSDQKEFGYSELQVTADCILFSDLSYV